MADVARRRLQAGRDGVVDSAKNCLSPELMNNNNTSNDNCIMSAEKSVTKSPSHESWLHNESGEEGADGKPSQRRHYHQFNKSSIFDFGPEGDGTDSKEATPTKQPPPITQDQKEESTTETEFGQRRHYHDRNRTTFDF